MNVRTLSFVFRTALSLTLVTLLTPAGRTCQEAEDTPSANEAEAVAEEPAELELSGTFIPTRFDVLEFWPRAHRGDWVFLEVAPHGAPVLEGDVIARLDPRSLAKAREQAERALLAAQGAARNAIDSAELAELKGMRTLASAELALKRARRGLEGWEKYELDLRQRDRSLTNQYQQHNVEDQIDELSQLEKMYRQDELTDATEEIVLKRARRNLARTRSGQSNRLFRQEFDDNFDLPVQAQARREKVQKAEEALDELHRSQVIEARTRSSSLEKAEQGVRDQEKALRELEADAKLLVLRSPRSGTLLHGAPETFRPGNSAVRHRRGGSPASRHILFTVADPDHLAVAVEVNEPDLVHVTSGAGVRVQAATAPDAKHVGRISVERYPTAASASKPDNRYRGTVKLEGAVGGVVVGTRAKVLVKKEHAPGSRGAVR